VATIYSHLHDRPPSLEGFGDRGKRLDRVMARALAKSRDARYDACGDVVEAARAELTAAPPDDGMPGAPAAGERRAGAHRLAPGGGRLRAAAIAAAAVAVVVAVVALALVLPDDGESGTPSGPTGGSPIPTGETGSPSPPIDAEPPVFIWTPAYTTEGTGLSDAAITDAVVVDGVLVAVGHAEPQSGSLGGTMRRLALRQRAGVAPRSGRRPWRRPATGG
jgi:hypothetical protein